MSNIMKTTIIEHNMLSTFDRADKDDIFEAYSMMNEKKMTYTKLTAKPPKGKLSIWYFDASEEDVKNYAKDNKLCVDTIETDVELPEDMKITKI